MKVKNETLIFYREKAGKTQAQVAKEALVSTRGYQKYELDGAMPNIGTAIRIAKALHTTVEQLWGGSPTTA